MEPEEVRSSEEGLRIRGWVVDKDKRYEHGELSTE
jgi:hypothetical protein